MIYEEVEIEDWGGGVDSASAISKLNQDMFFEVLKRVNDETFGYAAGVSKHWNSATKDELLWQLICTRHWPAINWDSEHVKSRVKELGGCRWVHFLLRVPSRLLSTAGNSVTPLILRLEHPKFEEYKKKLLELLQNNGG